MVEAIAFTIHRVRRKEEGDMKEVESFILDHTTVSAPYVTLVEKLMGQRGDVVCKYYITLVNPNIDSISTAGSRTLENYVADYLRKYLKNQVIDISLMGCRPGFNLTVFAEKGIDEIQDIIIKILEKVLEMKDITATRAFEYGKYEEHSLAGAKEYAEKVLEDFRGKRV